MRSLLALTIAFLAQFVVNAQPCAPQYQIPITIANNGSTALTGYQVSFTVNTAAPVTAGKMQSTGSDIYFSDVSGDTLYYWIQSGMNTSTTIFWVKVNNIASTGTTTIYLNYGATLAASYNIGDSTFLLFDDFSETSLDNTKWTSYVEGFGGIGLSGGSVNFATTETEATIVSTASFTPPVVSETRVTSLGGTSQAGSFYQLNSGSFDNGMGLNQFYSAMELSTSASSGCAGYQTGASYGSQAPGILQGIWSLLRDGAYATITWPGGTLSSSAAASVSGNQQIGMGMPCGSEGAMSIDWVLVRQYYAAGTTQSVGAEQMANTFSPLASSYESYTSSGSPNGVYGTCNSLIALVNTVGGTASGSTTATVWIDGTQPADYVERHYEIEPTVNGSATVTLYFTQSDFDAFNAVNTIQLPTGSGDLAGIANLLVEKRGGTSSNGSGYPDTYSGAITTITPTTGNIVWNAPQRRWEVTFPVSSFSGFFVKTTPSPLPLTLLNFSGNKQDDGTVTLQWQTADEENLHQFQVQRGTVSGNFATIGSVTPDNTAGPNTYTYADNTTWTSSERYYRLATVENDGSTSYSNVVALSSNGNTALTIYPNPVKDLVTIVAGNASVLHTTALLCDVTGRTVCKLQLDNPYTQVNIAGLSPGIYLLSFANGSCVRLLKQ